MFRFTSSLKRRCVHLNSGLLSFLGIVIKSGNVVFGYDCVKDYIAKKRGKVRIEMVALASNLSPRSRRNIENVCNSLDAKGILCCDIGCTIEEIYDATGRYAGILGITNQQMALRIQRFVHEGTPNLGKEGLGKKI